MSLRKAINEKCRDCIYDEYDKGTWRQQVEACPSKDCPLWLYRPKSTQNAAKTGEIPPGLKKYREKQIAAKLA